MRASSGAFVEWDRGRNAGALACALRDVARADVGTVGAIVVRETFPVRAVRAVPSIYNVRASDSSLASRRRVSLTSALA
jgi:hypothetical protein